MRSRRRELLITQGDLAKRLGVAPQQIQKYETGANRVSAATLFAAGLELDVAIEYFFDGLRAESCLRRSV
ncbi:MAG TPA: helix-turn-helix transcriptional regulator [Rhizomicrobium sp.]